jgi:hypothetical protein
MFKKILVSSLAAMTLSIPIMAGENGSLFSYQIGYSSNCVNTAGFNEEKTGGFYNGVDLMATGASGFGIGVGFDLNMWSPEKTTGISQGYSMYTMGATAKIGYTFQNRYNTPLKLKAGVGYGVMDITTHDGWGMQYEADAEYLLSKNYGIGWKYKYAQADMFNTTIKNDTNVFYLMFGY